MSSFDTHRDTATVGRLSSSRCMTPAGTLAILAVILMVTPMLGACGFRPLHADIDGTGSASEKLAAMQIAPIPGRVGQQLRNELIFKSTGGGLAPPAEYRLNIAIRERVTSTLVERTGDAKRQIYNLDAKFTLTRMSDKTELLKGSSFARAGFERFESIFSNVRARYDAENRAAKTVAQDLKARLSAFLATGA
jgi:LPS-assembly lipoprotein